ncbi:MAG: hypothetical protein QXK76_00720 [Candidatus Woesearchaeota archaeon]
MKKYNVFLYILIAIFAIQLVSAAPSLKVSLSKYEPYPAAPGDTVKIWLLIQNTASNDNTDTAKNLVVEVIPTEPFSIYNDAYTKTIAILGPKKDYLMDFNLKIDENALQGTNTFKVRIKESNSNIQIEQNINLFIQSRDTIITIESVDINPKEIQPGSEGTITVKVKNTAPNSLTDLSLKLQLQTILGSNIIDLPFAPIESSAEKKIFKLEPGQTAEFTYKIIVYPNAESKIYKIPFTLEYYDILGNKKNKSDFIGVIVNSKPEISVVIDRTDINSDKLAGTISLKIINKGLNDVKFLNVILKENNDYEILSESTTNYIGNLESDDYQTIDYKIAVKKGVSEIELPITIEYRDATNKYYKEEQKITFNILGNKKLGKVNGKGTSLTIIILIIIVALAGFIYYKKRIAKKNK